MRNASLAAILVMLLTAATPSLATTGDVQVSGSTVAGNQISITLQNTGSSTQAARVEVSVQLANGSTVTLLSPEVSVSAGGSSVVTVTASSPIVTLTDDPQPISG